MFTRFTKMTVGVRDAMVSIVKKFQAFHERRKTIADLEARIAPLQAQLKPLKAADTKDEAAIAEAVLRMGGPVIINDSFVQAETKSHVKKTSIGSDELLEGIAIHAPYIHARVMSVLELLKTCKANDNAAKPEKWNELSIRPATPEERRQSEVHVVWTE